LRRRETDEAARMSKSAPILRTVLIGTLLAGAAGLFVVTRMHLALDKESSNFVKDSVAAIGAHWDSDELWQRATPHFREGTSQDDVRAEFDAASSRLGPLVGYRAIGAKSSFLLTLSDHPAAAYILRADFQKGEADIEVRAVRAGSTWRIDGFAIGASPEMRKLLGMQG
jgi:hypothetical protein